MKRKLLSIFLACALLPTLSMPALAFDPAAEDLSGQIVLLHTNDSHSRVDDNMGFAAVSALKNAYTQAGATVLLLDAGDTLHGLPIANLSRGSYLVDIMNAAGYDAMTPGNHDFNYGAARLTELSEQMNFPLLSANVVTSTGSPLFKPYTILERNGISFGIFGLSTPETAYKTSPDNVKGLTFSDPIQAAKETVQQLQAAKVDYIICLSHLGMDESSSVTSTAVAQAVSGIDVIIDGHSHTVLPEGLRVLAQASDDPTHETILASTGEYIQNVGAVTIGKDAAIHAQLVSAADWTETDPAVDTLVGALKEQVSALLDVEIGSTSVLLDGARESNRTSETNLGNLVADAFRWASGADIALTNGGGIRDSIPVGAITKRNLNIVFPFGNYVVTVQVTGQQLLDALENGVSGYPATSGGFPQISGFSFCFDPAKPAGERIGEVTIGDAPLDLNETYLLATNNFTAVGGDNYTMLNNPIVNEFGALDDIVVDYITSLGGVVGAAYDGPKGRITTRTEVSFSDVFPSDWFYDCVFYAAEHSLMRGVGDGSFAPSQTMTRGMFLTVLYRLAGSPAYSASMHFADVLPGQWYTDGALWAAEAGIAQGAGTGTLGIQDSITREETCTMLYRYIQKNGGGFEGSWMFLLPYEDTASIADWAYESMAFCSMNGMLTGTNQNTCEPKRTTQRAEAAALLARFDQWNHAADAA